jgi:hypothetical protein
MKWLRIGLTVFDAVSRVVDRIGPVSFEPMEKHPPPRHRTAPTTADPKAEYSAEGGDYESDEEHEEKIKEPMAGDDGSAPAPDSTS